MKKTVMNILQYLVAIVLGILILGFLSLVIGKYLKAERLRNHSLSDQSLIQMYGLTKMPNVCKFKNGDYVQVIFKDGSPYINYGGKKIISAHLLDSRKNYSGDSVAYLNNENNDMLIMYYKDYGEEIYRGYDVHNCTMIYWNDKMPTRDGRLERSI